MIHNNVNNVSADSRWAECDLLTRQNMYVLITQRCAQCALKNIQSRSMTNVATLLKLLFKILVLILMFMRTRGARAPGAPFPP